jgi:hypothetical protein
LAAEADALSAPLLAPEAPPGPEALVVLAVRCDRDLNAMKFVQSCSRVAQGIVAAALLTTRVPSADRTGNGL